MQDLVNIFLSTLGKQAGNLPLAPIGALLGLLFLGLILGKAKRARKPRCAAFSFADLRRKPILTDHEKGFFPCLLDALPQYHVFPQVSLDAVMQPVAGLSNGAACSLRNSFSQKHPDFVICEKGSLKVVAIVELDDSWHDAKKDSERDIMLGAVKYPVLRFTDKDKPWREAIAKKFATLN
ncbi:MAG: DUF2726 domain-containing protein [Alphaproteobacteria bacterium]|nr:DUF2726 domain-containing protein [Alphaproteobacteria bacterium]